MMGRGCIMRAAAAGTLTVDLDGGDLIASTRASLLADSDALLAMHIAQLAATAGTPAYTDGMILTTQLLSPSGPALAQTTLAQAVFDAVAAMRAVAYLPTANITDSDPSTYFLTRNLVLISDAAEASLVSTGAAVSSAGGINSSPVALFIAVWVAMCIFCCAVVISISRRVLAFRTVPLERLSTLPNSVLQLLEASAASSVAAAERALECTQREADADSADSQDECDDGTDWRYVNVTPTSKDVQKGTSERSRTRVLFLLVMIAPLLAAFVFFILMSNAITTGTQSAEASSNGLVSSTLTYVAIRQVVYYSITAATLSDAASNNNALTTDGNTSLLETAHGHPTIAFDRINGMFFGAAGDLSVDAALKATHFGDLCATGVLPLSPFESSRCGSLAGGACHSGLYKSFRQIVNNMESMMGARASLALPDAPSASQVARLRGLMDSQHVTDARIIEAIEAADAMEIDANVRAARVQSAVAGATNTGTALVASLIALVAMHQVVRGRSAAAICLHWEHTGRFSCVTQVALVHPVLRRAVDDVRTARWTLLMLPPELLMRLPVVVRFLHEITETDTGIRRRQSEEGATTGAEHSSAQLSTLVRRPC
jgi:hypothetical protein